MSDCGCGRDGWFSPPDPDCPRHGLRAQAAEYGAAADRRDAERAKPSEIETLRKEVAELRRLLESKK